MAELIKNVRDFLKGVEKKEAAAEKEPEHKQKKALLLDAINDLEEELKKLTRIKSKVEDEVESTTKDISSTRDEFRAIKDRLAVLTEKETTLTAKKEDLQDKLSRLKEKMGKVKKIEDELKEV
ncbi:MAG: hypothetical protein Q7J54_05405 [Candidatus Woesearchaeota archaeon]|nr:hypothetical protein [Candidatus Woesearchaeota archaeon]